MFVHAGMDAGRDANPIFFWLLKNPFLLNNNNTFYYISFNNGRVNGFLHNTCMSRSTVLYVSTGLLRISISVGIFGGFSIDISRYIGQKLKNSPNVSIFTTYMQ
jgi:hypothetical protein